MSLKDKLKKLSESGEKNVIDWEKNKQEWIGSVNKLYKLIQDNWLSELEDEGLLKISTSPISISEEHIGVYSIDRMEISYAAGNIVFEPVGRNIIGGDGRIDFYLKGEFSKGIMLILLRESSKDNWFLVSKQNRREQELLTKSSLENVISQWIEG